MNEQKRPFDRREHCRRIASRGGRATVARHGREHMQKIGRKGFEVTTERYFFGSVAAHLSWFRARGAFEYWKQTGLAMKRDGDGRGIWDAPGHPAHGEPMF